MLFHVQTRGSVGFSLHGWDVSYSSDTGLSNLQSGSREESSVVSGALCSNIPQTPRMAAVQQLSLQPLLDVHPNCGAHTTRSAFLPLLSVSPPSTQIYYRLVHKPTSSENDKETPCWKVWPKVNHKPLIRNGTNPDKQLLYPTLY
jgi:hypothetical protein